VWSGEAMSTIAQSFLLHTKAVCTVLLYMLLLGLAISRFYIFYDVYIQENTKKNEDAWLRIQCKNPEFYSNIRQHTDLCSEVEQHAQSWIFLTALNAMFAKNQWCGTKKTCAEYVHSLLVQGVAWPLVGCFGLLMLALPYIIAAKAKNSIIAQYHRHQMFQQQVSSPFYSPHFAIAEENPCYISRHSSQHCLQYPTGGALAAGYHPPRQALHITAIDGGVDTSSSSSSYNGQKQYYDLQKNSQNSGTVHLKLRGANFCKEDSFEDF
jgi:hypothetical protein